MSISVYSVLRALTKKMLMFQQILLAIYILLSPILTSFLYWVKMARNFRYQREKLHQPELQAAETPRKIFLLFINLPKSRKLTGTAMYSVLSATTGTMCGRRPLSRVKQMEKYTYCRAKQPSVHFVSLLSKVSLLKLSSRIGRRNPQISNPWVIKKPDILSLSQ